MNAARGDGFLSLALRANSFRAVTPWFDSTAFRTHQAQHSHLGYGRQVLPAEEFLVSSRINRHDREFSTSVAGYLPESFVSVVAQTDTEVVAPDNQVELPSSAPLSLPLDELIKHRRSTRSFNGDPVGLAEVAALVRAAAGITRPDETLPGRAVPSGGGLYPVELHIVALRVDGLDRGLYRFAPRVDVFEHYGDTTSVRTLLDDGLIDLGEVMPLERVALIALLVGRPWRSMRKYGPRGLRFVLHEVGAMSEHLHLAATALGLGSTDWSSFYDEPANRSLGLDGLRHTLLHMVLVGRP